MTALRAEAVSTWLYAAGFGIPAIPVALYLVRRGRLPTFFGLFEMYGGRWSSRVGERVFVLLLLAFFGLSVVVALAAGFVWKASFAGAIVSLLLMPVESVFWVGFDLPIPKAIGIIRIVLLALGWSALR